MKLSHFAVVFSVGVATTAIVFWMATTGSLPDYAVLFSIIPPFGIGIYLADSRNEALLLSLTSFVSVLAGYVFYWAALIYIASRI